MRTERHGLAGSVFAQQKDVDLPADMLLKSADLNLGDVESAHSSARFFANVVAEKKLGGGRPAKKGSR